MDSELEKKDSKSLEIRIDEISNDIIDFINYPKLNISLIGGNEEKTKLFLKEISSIMNKESILYHNFEIPKSNSVYTKENRTYLTKVVDIVSSYGKNKDNLDDNGEKSDNIANESYLVENDDVHPIQSSEEKSVKIDWEDKDDDYNDELKFVDFEDENDVIEEDDSDNIEDAMVGMMDMLKPMLGNISNLFSGMSGSLNDLNESLEEIEEEIKNDDSLEDVDSDNSQNSENEYLNQINNLTGLLGGLMGQLNNTGLFTDKDSEKSNNDDNKNPFQGGNPLKLFENLMGSLGGGLPIANKPNVDEYNKDENNDEYDDRLVFRKNSVDYFDTNNDYLTDDWRNRKENGITIKDESNFADDIIFKLGYISNSQKHLILLIENIGAAQELTYYIFNELLKNHQNLPVFILGFYNLNDIKRTGNINSNKYLKLLTTRFKIDKLGKTIRLE